MQTEWIFCKISRRSEWQSHRKPCMFVFKCTPVVLQSVHFWPLGFIFVLLQPNSSACLRQEAIVVKMPSKTIDTLSLLLSFRTSVLSLFIPAILSYLCLQSLCPGSPPCDRQTCAEGAMQVEGVCPHSTRGSGEETAGGTEAGKVLPVQYVCMLYGSYDSDFSCWRPLSWVMHLKKKFFLLNQMCIFVHYFAFQLKSTDKPVQTFHQTKHVLILTFVTVLLTFLLKSRLVCPVLKGSYWSWKFFVSLGGSLW